MPVYFVNNGIKRETKDKLVDHVGWLNVRFSKISTSASSSDHEILKQHNGSYNTIKRLLLRQSKKYYCKYCLERLQHKWTCDRGSPMEIPTAATRCLTRSFSSQALVLPHSLCAIESRNVLIRIPQNGQRLAIGISQYSILNLVRRKRTSLMQSLSERIVLRLWFYDKLHWDQDRHANACVDIVLANSPPPPLWTILAVVQHVSTGFKSCSYRTRILCNKAWLR